MTALPGEYVRYQDAQPAAPDRPAISTQFLIGELERGPDTPTPVRSVRELAARCGARTALSAPMHDDVSDHVAQGGGTAWVIPLRGPDATYAEASFLDASNAVSFKLRARDRGGYGNRLGARSTLANGRFTVTVHLDGATTPIATSPSCDTAAELQAWALTAASGLHVTVVPGVGGDPVTVGTTKALAGGDDDLDGVTPAHITTLAGRFTPGLNVGGRQLPREGCHRLPGRSSRQSNLALMDALATSASETALVAQPRVAKLELPAILDTAPLLEDLAAITDHPAADRVDVLFDRVTARGATSASEPRVAGVGVWAAAREAVNDAAGVSPNQPARGPEYGTLSPDAVGVLVGYTDEQREVLHAAGANGPHLEGGRVVLDGSRTAADSLQDPAGLRLGSARTRMAVHAVALERTRLFRSLEFDAEGVVLRRLEASVEAGILAYSAAIRASFYLLEVTADIVDSPDTPSESRVLVTVRFQAARDAPVIEITIAREA